AVPRRTARPARHSQLAPEPYVAECGRAAFPRVARRGRGNDRDVEQLCADAAVRWSFGLGAPEYADRRLFDGPGGAAARRVPGRAPAYRFSRNRRRKLAGPSV